jgi:hypothetical protein
MFEYSREKIREECEQNGISWARAVEPDRISAIQVHIREWINDFERKEADEAAKEQRSLTKAAVDAARDAADVSRDAAIASKSSAFWTMWAAIAAAVSALVPIFQAFGWLPKPP